MTTIGECDLCQENKKLCDGHLYPRFYIKWLKKTSVTGYLRGVNDINMPKQDGPKKYFLCDTCEQRLCTHEKWFAEQAFHPYIKGGNGIPDGEELLYFAISILWRWAIHLEWPENVNSGTRDSVLMNWRKFLLGETSIIGLTPHVFMTDTLDINQFKHAKYENLYLTRWCDAAIASLDGLTVIYVKFARFIFLGIVEGYNSELWKGTLIHGEKGNLIQTGQIILDTRLYPILLSRMNILEKRFAQISSNQKDRIDAGYLERKSTLGEKDLDKITKHENAHNIDPTLHAFRNIRSSLPNGFHITNDHTILMSEEIVPIQNRVIHDEKYSKPEIVIQTAVSIDNENRYLLIYGVSPSGKGELFGYLYNGGLGNSLGEREILTSKEKQDIAEEQYFIFREIVDLAVSKLRPDCSFAD